MPYKKALSGSSYLDGVCHDAAAHLGLQQYCYQKNKFSKMEEFFGRNGFSIIALKAVLRDSNQSCFNWHKPIYMY